MFNIVSEKQRSSDWRSGLDSPCIQCSVSSPPDPSAGTRDIGKAKIKNIEKDIFQSTTVAALGSSAALGGAAAIAAVTASAIPLIHHSLRRNSRVSPSRSKDISRCLSPNSAVQSTASQRFDGGSILVNGNLISNVYPKHTSTLQQI